MTRDDLIIATALILFAAFVLGWFSCWLIGRLTRPGRAEIARHHQLAADLHAAEAARDRLHVVERDGRRPRGALLPPERPAQHRGRLVSERREPREVGADRHGIAARRRHRRLRGRSARRAGAGLGEVEQHVQEREAVGDAVMEAGHQHRAAVDRALERVERPERPIAR